MKDNAEDFNSDINNLPMVINNTSLMDITEPSIVYNYLISQLPKPESIEESLCKCFNSYCATI